MGDEGIKSYRSVLMFRPLDVHIGKRGLGLGLRRPACGDRTLSSQLS